MRCVRCSNEIEDNEVLCETCKKELKKEASRNEVKQFEQEIEANKMLNDDENTKELVDLESLSNEMVYSDEEIENDTNELIDKVEETREDKFKPKKSKKKVIIIVSVICALIIILFIIVFALFLNKSKDEVIEIDYEKTLSRYGKKVEGKLEDLEEEIEWDELVKNIEYDYEVVCKIHEIYSDKKIYLDECKIDDKKIKYSYGTKQKEIESKIIEIFKDGENYSNSKGDLVGKITCEDQNCEYVRAFDDYVIVKEKNLYNLYNYKDEKKVLESFNDVTNIINTGNTLHAIYYTKDNSKNLYSAVGNKLIENLDGRPIYEEENFDPTIMYKYGYVILSNKNYSFLNLKTGKINYTIDDNILKFEEDAKNNIVYILTYKKDINTFKVINSHGKELFGKEINYFKLTDDSIIISDKVSFTVYDSKLNVLSKSKTYDSLISMYDDCAIVMDKSVIKLVDLQDNTLGQFELGKEYQIDTKKSGWDTLDGKSGLIIYFKNSQDKLFYDSKTGEMELIEMEN